MTDNLAKPKVWMTIRHKRSGSLYTIEIIEADRVYLRPYWSGIGRRSTWKSLARLWCDYYRVDDTSVTASQP